VAASPRQSWLAACARQLSLALGSCTQKCMTASQAVRSTSLVFEYSPDRLAQVFTSSLVGLTTMVRTIRAPVRRAALPPDEPMSPNISLRPHTHAATPQRHKPVVGRLAHHPESEVAATVDSTATRTPGAAVSQVEVPTDVQGTHCGQVVCESICSRWKSIVQLLLSWLAAVQALLARLFSATPAAAPPVGTTRPIDSDAEVANEQRHAAAKLATRGEDRLDQALRAKQPVEDAALSTAARRTQARQRGQAQPVANLRENKADDGAAAAGGPRKKSAGQKDVAQQRSRYDFYLQLPAAPVLDEAAATIQAIQRGRAVRKQAREEHAAAAKVDNRLVNLFLLLLVLWRVLCYPVVCHCYNVPCHTLLRRSRQ
jgi:hypothetical protein